MFRIKKVRDGEDATAAQRPEATEEVPVAQVAPRRAAPLPVRTMNGPNFPVDVARRSADLLVNAGRHDPTPSAPPSAARDKALVIGKEVHLKGEVLSCDKMVLEGEADVVVAGCRILQIGPSGIFRGTAEVTEGEIAGQFEGDLIASERLLVRSTGRIRGTLRYAQITIEAGGQIIGEMKTLDGSGTSGQGSKDVQLPPAFRAGSLPRGETIAAPSGLEAGAPADRT